MTVGPWSRAWGSCGVCATVRLMSSPKPTRREEGVGCVGRVVLRDCEGQGERHEKVQEGAFCSSLGDPPAWLQEGDDACSSADRVFAGADVAGGEAVEGEA